MLSLACIMANSQTCELNVLHGGFHKWGYPNSGMVYFMEYPLEIDNLQIEVRT